MDEMRDDRVNSFNTYYELLRPLKEKGLIDLPTIPDNCIHNGHMFYVKCKDLDERQKLQVYLRENGIGSAFHYIPLHSAPEGLNACRFNGEDVYTTKESERLLRLPMYYKLTNDDIKLICENILKFYKS